MAKVQCELVDRCKFFHDKLPSMPDYADLLKELYCLDDFGECARFMVYSKFGLEAVPPDLYPNELFKARIVIANAEKKKKR